MNKKFYSDAGDLIAVVQTIADFRNGVNFFTPADNLLQVGVLNHSKGHKIQAHEHFPKNTLVDHMEEVLIVLTGSMEVDLFWKNNLLDTVLVNAGQIILLNKGGHGFRIIEETQIVEVKLGPYSQKNDKYFLEIV